RHPRSARRGERDQARHQGIRHRRPRASEAAGCASRRVKGGHAARGGKRRDRMSEGWIGVDLDGTLAYYDQWRGPEHIGEPVPAMLERVQRWLAEGKDVRIFTARVERATVALSMAGPDGDPAQNFSVVEACIRLWCE